MPWALHGKAAALSPLPDPAGGEAAIGMAGSPWGGACTLPDIDPFIVLVLMLMDVLEFLNAD